MAGLQYNFFPTDFLYPRQQQLRAANTDATHKPVPVPPVLSLQKRSSNAVVVDDLPRHHNQQQPLPITTNNMIDVNVQRGLGGYKTIKVPSPSHGQNQANSDQLNSLSLLLFFPDQET